jgi:pimeloyl-ACP methyl ester carboxylesterase
MTDGRRALLGAGVVAGAAAGIAGAAYAAERSLVARVKRAPDPDAGGPLLPPFDESFRFPSHDGGTIYAISRGKGPTLVFCHGVTLSNRVWVKQFEALPALGFRCVAFDSRGHGESSAGSTGHSIDNLARDVRTVLEYLNLRDVVLVGHSMGGAAAQAFAIRHSDVAAARVRGLVLMSTLARVHIGGSGVLRKFVERAAGRGPAANQLMAQPNLGFLLARIGFGRDPQASHVELTREMIVACEADESRLAIGALFGLDLIDELPEIQLPTLVLSGSADVLTPPAESRRIAALIPGARLEVFKGAGHMLMLERSQEVDQLIVEFARDLGAGSPFRRFWPRRPARDGRRSRGLRRRAARQRLEPTP